MDGGPERIEDGAELTAIRTQARHVRVRSVLAATAATVVGLLLP